MKEEIQKKVELFLAKCIENLPVLFNRSRKLHKTADMLKIISTTVDSPNLRQVDVVLATLDLMAKEVKSSVTMIEQVKSKVNDNYQQAIHYQRLVDSFDDPYTKCSECSATYTRDGYDRLMLTFEADDEPCGECGHMRNITIEVRTCACGCTEFESP